jgi:sulfatase maturation enzyme AslB (radical SAM superfamily)
VFKFNQLESIHLEISNNCQASCPMCSRNHHGGLENPLIKVQDWTLEDFKTIINQDVLDQLKQLYFCGNFGDPLLNNDLIPMCEYVKNNSSVSIRIHTNGSLRSTEWWKNLAKALPADHLVIFGIDGLEDTHDRYRIGTDYNKIIKNARAFIEAGGYAEWAYIVFEHNQHQVTAAKNVAADIGFKRFTTKNSSRFVGDTNFEVYDQEGNTVDILRPPKDTVIKFLDKTIIENYKEVVKNTEIDCYVLKTKEVYIDAYRNLMPCCFLAATPYNYSTVGSMIYDVRQHALQQYNELVRKLGTINTLKKPVKDIIDSHEYQTVWNEYWTTKKLITCARTCGKNELSKPVDQFIERELLNG